MTFHPVDVHVGTRIRQRRTLLGMSQTALGKAIGITFQQVQKYEKGGNRLGASRLFEFASVLDVPVEYFFDGMTSAAGRSPTRRQRQEIKYPQRRGKTTDPLSKRETLELVRSYFKIRNPQTRRRITQMISALADG